MKNNDDMRIKVNLSPVKINFNSWYYEDERGIELYIQIPGFPSPFRQHIPYETLSKTLSRVDLSK